MGSGSGLHAPPGCTTVKGASLRAAPLPIPPPRGGRAPRCVDFGVGSRIGSDDAIVSRPPVWAAPSPHRGEGWGGGSDGANLGRGPGSHTVRASFHSLSPMIR